jgi:hypothetical protein
MIAVDNPTNLAFLLCLIVSLPEDRTNVSMPILVWTWYLPNRKQELYAERNDGCSPFRHYERGISIWHWSILRAALWPWGRLSL